MIRRFALDSGDWDFELRRTLSVVPSGSAEGDPTLASLRRWAKEEHGTALLSGLPGEGTGELAYELAWYWLDRGHERDARTTEVWYCGTSEARDLPGLQPGTNRLEIVDARRDLGGDPFSPLEKQPSNHVRLFLAHENTAPARLARIDRRHSPAGWLESDCVARLTAFARSNGAWLSPESAGRCLEQLRVWDVAPAWSGRRSRVLVEIAEEAWRQAMTRHGSAQDAARTFGDEAVQRLEQMLKTSVGDGGEPIRQVIDVCGPLVLPLLRNEESATPLLDADLVSNLLFELYRLDLGDILAKFPHLVRKIPAPVGSSGPPGLQAVTPMLWQLGQGARGRPDGRLLSALAMSARKRRSIAGAGCLWELDRTAEALDVVLGQDVGATSADPTGMGALWAKIGMRDVKTWQQRLQASIEQRRDPGERGRLAQEVIAAGLLASVWEQAPAPAAPALSVSAETAGVGASYMFRAAPLITNLDAAPVPDETWTAVVALSLRRALEYPEPRRSELVGRIFEARPAEAWPAALRSVVDGRQAEATLMTNCLLRAGGGPGRLLAAMVALRNRSARRDEREDQVTAALLSPLLEGGPAIDLVRTLSADSGRSDMGAVALALLSQARSAGAVINAIAAALASPEVSPSDLRARAARAAAQAGSTVAYRVTRVITRALESPLAHTCRGRLDALKELPLAITRASRTQDASSEWVARHFIQTDLGAIGDDTQIVPALAALEPAPAVLMVLWIEHAVVAASIDSAESESSVRSVNELLEAQGASSQAFRPTAPADGPPLEARPPPISMRAAQVLDQARLAASNRDDLSAHDLLRVITQNEPTCTQAWLLIVELYRQLKKPERALRELENGLNHIKFPDMLFLKARCLLDLGRAKEALEILGELRRRDLGRNLKRTVLGEGAKAAAATEDWPIAVSWAADRARLRAPGEAPPELEQILDWLGKCTVLEPGVSAADVVRHLLPMFATPGSIKEVELNLSAGRDEVVIDLIGRTDLSQPGAIGFDDLATALHRFARHDWADLAEAVVLIGAREYVQAESLLAGTEGRIPARAEVALLRARCAVAAAEDYRAQGIRHAAVDWVRRGWTLLRIAEWAGFGGVLMLRLRAELAVQWLLTAPAESDHREHAIDRVEGALRFLRARAPADERLASMLFDTAVLRLRLRLGAAAAARDVNAFGALVRGAQQTLRNLLDLEGGAGLPDLSFEARAATAFVRVVEDSTIEQVPDSAMQAFADLLAEAGRRNARLASPARELQQGELDWGESRLWLRLAEVDRAVRSAAAALDSWLAAQKQLHQSGLSLPEQQRLSIDLNFKIRQATDIVRGEGAAARV